MYGWKSQTIMNKKNFLYISKYDLTLKTNFVKLN